MKPQIKAIHHIALKCQGIENFNETMHFYRDLLGLTEVRRWGTDDAPIVMLDTGAGLLEIFANAPDRPDEGPLRHIALEVNSADVCAETVRAAGYEITMEPKDIVLGNNPPYPARIAFCQGPVGEALEFFEVYAK